MQPRNIGMMVSHNEIQHLITQMADVIRNAAYKVANERWPEGSDRRSEYFDETGTLMAMDEISVRVQLVDALEHYVMFNTSGTTAAMDFNYYLEDSFQMVQPYINANPHILSYLSAKFAEACGILASTLSPVIQDLQSCGQSVEKIESFVQNTDETYYVVYGENFDNQETYDPVEDDLSTVDVYQSPEELAAIEKRRLQNQIVEAIAYRQDLEKKGVVTTATPHLDTTPRVIEPLLIEEMG